MREAVTICPHHLRVDLWPFNLESGVRVKCDVGYLCANFSLPRPRYSRLRPDVRDRQVSDRQTSDAQHRLILPPYGGWGIIIIYNPMTSNMPARRRGSSNIPIVFQPTVSRFPGVCRHSRGSDIKGMRRQRDTRRRPDTRRRRQMIWRRRRVSGHLPAHTFDVTTARVPALAREATGCRLTIGMFDEPRLLAGMFDVIALLIIINVKKL